MDNQFNWLCAVAMWDIPGLGVITIDWRFYFIIASLELFGNEDYSNRKVRRVHGHHNTLPINASKWTCYLALSINFSCPRLRCLPLLLESNVHRRLLTLDDLGGQIQDIYRTLRVWRKLTQDKQYSANYEKSVDEELLYLARLTVDSYMPVLGFMIFTISSLRLNRTY